LILLPDTILYGGHGAVAGGANMFPGLFVDLYNASVDRDLERIAINSDAGKLNNT
jgi:2-dehydro-3-deoxy-D-pentonate aldolase